MITETVAAGNANTAADRCIAPPPSVPYRQSLVNKLARRVREIPGMQAVVIGDLHINHYLREVSAPSTVLYLPLRSARTRRACRAINRLAVPRILDWVAPSPVRHTYYARCRLALEATGIDYRLRHADAIVQMFGNDAYRHAPASVYPSLYEGFGIPPPEAITSGCPVACADRSSIPEVVGQAALRFDPEDIDAVSVALECIAFDDDLHARLRIADQGHAQRFPWDRCAAETVAVYRRLLPA